VRLNPLPDHQGPRARPRKPHPPLGIIVYVLLVCWLYLSLLNPKSRIWFRPSPTCSFQAHVKLSARRFLPRFLGLRKKCRAMRFFFFKKIIKYFLFFFFFVLFIFFFFYFFFFFFFLYFFFNR